jgi:hypothetical protein
MRRSLSGGWKRYQGWVTRGGEAGGGRGGQRGNPLARFTAPGPLLAPTLSQQTLDWVVNTAVFLLALAFRQDN